MPTSFRQGWQQLPQLFKQPALLLGWLRPFHWIQVVVPAIVLILVLAAPPVSRSLVDTFYPEQGFTKRLFSALTGNDEHQQLRQRRYWQFLGLFCLSGGGAIFFLLVADVPRLFSLSASKTASFPDARHADAAANDRTQARKAPLQNAARTVGANQRYRIERTIASGGAGTVYEAFDTLLERSVALKELYDTEDDIIDQKQRFQAEARILASFNHPHIVPIYDMFDEGGNFWLVMELLSGGDLSGRLQQHKALPVVDCLKITRDIASGLACAHAQGLVHRDIKPGNILFARDGSLRITDFGIAKANRSNVKTQQGLILGSPGYMSPEQAAGESVDARSDLYSLGITLYQMLTGQVPFEGDTTAVLLKHITQIPDKPSQLNPALPAALDVLVMKMLAKKPDDRFQDCQQVVDLINRMFRKKS